MKINYILEAVIFSLIVEQIINAVIHYRDIKHIKLSLFFSRSEWINLKLNLVSSLVTAVWLKAGIESIDFAISFALASVVIVDCLILHRELARQALCLNELQNRLNIKEKKMFKSIGNESAEVFKEVFLGFFCSLIYYLIVSFL